MKKTLREPAIITSPIILLMLAACGGGGGEGLVLSANVTGGTGDDTLAGNSADNTIRGGAGNDRLDGRAGNDILDGGPGDRDVAEYTSDPSGIIGSLVTATVKDGWGDTDTLINIERIYGSAFNDVITGEDGNDKLYGGDNEDQLEGDAGDDELYGEGNQDKLYGGAGNDLIDGGESAEDRAHYDDDPAGVTVNLATGRATDGWGDTDTLRNIENVHGSQYDDMLSGDENDNELDGGDGNDKLYGGLGDDWFNGDDGNDEIYGQGDDDSLNGADGNDRLYGYLGDDWLEGGEGDDWLYGGRGYNNLTGDDGIDRFVLDTTDGATSGRVRDFKTSSTNGADKIVIELEGVLNETQRTSYTNMITSDDDRTLTIGDLTITVEENSDGETTNTYIRGTYDDGTNDATSYTLLLTGINPDDLTASYFEFI